MQSISSFKQELRNTIFPTRVVHPYYMHGNRSLSVIHARLRNNCSNIQHDLYLNHISDVNLCSHCTVPEDAEHYFFQCKLFRNERYDMFLDTRALHPLSCNTLLFGNESYAFADNIIIVNAVHKFIKCTRRFDN